MFKDSSMSPWKYEMRDLGFNYRLTDIQCSLGLSQLKKLDSFISSRKSIAKRYDTFFVTHLSTRYIYIMVNLHIICMLFK